MVRKILATTFVVMILAVAAGTALADEPQPVTLEGKVLCAKCALHEEGREKCQNVLMVKQGDEETYYYLAESAASKEFGDVCMSTPTVRVTGTVSKDGDKMLLTASKMERIEQSS